MKKFIDGLTLPCLFVAPIFQVFFAILVSIGNKCLEDEYILGTFRQYLWVFGGFIIVIWFVIIFFESK